MAQQTSEVWTAEDFAAPGQPDVWTAEDFEPAQPAQQGFPSSLAGKYAGIGHALAGGALEGLSSLAGFAGKVIDLPQTLLGGVTGPSTPAASKAGAQLVAPLEQSLSQTAQEIYPPEERQQAGLPGQVMQTAGQMVTAAPFVAVGAPAAAFAFAAQNAMPAYYDVLAKTGSEEKANQALWANSAIGQLEFLGGGEKLAGSILKKLMTGDVGKAIKNAVLRMTLSQGAEVGTELAQTGLSDLLYENLTGEDLANWERLKQTAPVALLASAPFVVVDTALSQGAPSAGTATQPQGAQGQTAVPQSTVAVEGPTPSPDTTTAAPVVPVSSEGNIPKSAKVGVIETPAEQLVSTAKKAKSVQDRVQGEYQLHTKSLEELDALEEEILSEQKRLKIRETERKLNRAEAEGATEAELRAMLTPEQEGHFYYTENTKYPQLEHVRDVRRAIADARFAESKQELASALKYRMGELSSLLAEDNLSERALADNEVRALAVFREAQEKASKEGWDFSEVLKSAAQGYAGRFGDPEDAIFMLEGFLRRAEKGKKQEPSTARKIGAASKQLNVAATEEVRAPRAVATTSPAPSIAAAGTVPETEALREKIDEDMAAPEVGTPEEVVAPEATGIASAEPEAEAKPPQSQEATGIKNRTVAKELEKMGLPPSEKTDGKTFGQLLDEAQVIKSEDEGSTKRLIQDLQAKPRAPSGVEAAQLAVEARRLVTERSKAEQAFIEDPSDANKQRIETSKKDYSELANVLDRAGTESSISLSARKMMLKEDYSLAAMERAVQVSKGGKELTQQESARVKELHEKIAATQKAFDEYVSAAELRDARREAEAILLKEKKSILSKPRRLAKERSIQETKRKIDEILNKLGSSQEAAAGLNPAKVGLTAQLAANYLKLGYQNFDLFASEVVARIGEHIRPYLRPAWDEAKKEQDREMLEAYKARKRTDIAKLEERSKNKQFKLEKRTTPLEKDPEAIRLKAEYERAKRKYEAEKKRHERASRSKGQKTLDAAKEVMTLPRAIRFSFDLVPLLRQGLFFGVPELVFSPAKGVRRIASGISAMSRAKAEALDAASRLGEAGKVRDFAEAAGLELPALEEETSSELAMKIPGIPASSRMYNAYMNSQRLAAFGIMAEAIPNITMDEARQIAKGVNILTGRGNPKGGLAAAIDGLGSILTSPRLLISRLQTVTGVPMWRGTRRTRLLFAKQYARMLAAYAVLYGLAEMAGELFDEDVDVDWHITSSDVGKILVGKKRIDVLGGMSQIATLSGRIGWGEKGNLRGKGSVPIRGEDKPYKGDDALDLLKEFMRYKLSPTAGVIADLMTGEQVERGDSGKRLPVTKTSIAKSLLVPVSVEDIPEEMKKLGVPGMVANRLMSLFGAGVRDYHGEKWKPRGR